MKFTTYLAGACMAIAMTAAAGGAGPDYHRVPDAPSGKQRINLLDNDVSLFKNSVAGNVTLSDIPSPRGNAPSVGKRTAPLPGSDVRLVGCDLKKAGTDETSVVMFRATPSYEPTVLASDDVFRANGGGCYAGDDYHYISYTRLFGLVIAEYYHYDATTMKRIEVRDASVGCISHDMTYDATDGKIYGIFYNDDMNGYVFGTLDPASLTRTAIADLPCEYFAIAASPEGVIYGIDEEGTLNRFDKTTGSAVAVGPTGVVPKYLQSASFDASTGRLYWAANHEDATSALYEVNTTTGAASKVFDFAGNEQITALGVLAPEAASAAPAVVENLSARFDNGSLHGTISFTAPDHTYNGKPLADSKLSYKVTIDGKSVAEGETAIGAKVEVQASVADTGFHTVEVTVANSVGDSPVASSRLWYGVDTPAPVTALNIASDDNDIILTWKAPTEGVNGGFINTAGLRYTVRSLPGEKVVSSGQSATEYREAYEKKGMKPYAYSVTVHYGTLESEPVESGKILAGGAYDTPYSENFDRPEAADYFKVIDVAGDGKTWELSFYELDYTGEMQCGYTSDNPKDDWMVSPPIHLVAGKLYTISMDVKARGGWRYPEKLEVLLAPSDKLEDLTGNATVAVLPEAEYESRTFENYSALVQVPSDGNYYLAFHAMSDADMDVLGIDNIKVEEESDATAPKAATEFTALADDKGANGATISFVAPSESIGGDKLESLSKAEISRDGVAVHTLTPVAPGAKCSWHDDNPGNGAHNYTLRVYSGDKKGLEAAASTFVGPDVPGLPTKVRITEADGIVTLTWEAPTVGGNGGYIDPSALTYTVFDAESEIIKEDISGTSYRFMPLVEGQELFLWSVAAVNDKGMGNSTRSNILAIGTPMSLPFKESFPNAENTNSPWGQYVSGMGGRWYTSDIGLSPIASPQDNDKGLLTFIPTSAGDEALIYSGKIDVSKAKAPVVDFWFYSGDNNEGNKLAVDVSSAHGAFTTVYTVDYSAAKPGWNLARAHLKDVDCSGFIQFGMRASCADAARHLHVDNIEVRDPAACDLGVVAVEGPSQMKVGEKAEVSVRIVNVGVEQADGYTVELWANGAFLQSVPGVTLDELATATFDFEVIPTVSMSSKVSFGAKIICQADGNLANNIMIGDYVPSEMPDYPTVQGLAGTYSDGNVVLEWPALSDCVLDPSPLTETFDSYDPFIISNIGDWKVVDVDGGPGTYTISNTASTTLSYANAGKPMAFQVFNPSHAGLLLVNADGNPTGWMPHSGSQMLAAFGDVDGQNDDWLISPALSGDAQTLTFYARSYSDMYGLESIEVLTSATDDDTASFERVKGIASLVPAEWTQYTVNLPEGTRHFAIRCVSRNAFVLLVDDISYVPVDAMPRPLELQGYNVYREGVRINDKMLTEASYKDPMQPGKRPRYAVTAVYDKGESDFSNIVTVVTSGVTDVNGDEALKVRSGAGVMTIECAPGTELTVIAADGRTIWQGVSDADKLTVKADTGVYVVKGAGRTVKTAVR